MSRYVWFDLRRSGTLLDGWPAHCPHFPRPQIGYPYTSVMSAQSGNAAPAQLGTAKQLLVVTMSRLPPRATAGRRSACGARRDERDEGPMYSNMVPI